MLQPLNEQFFGKHKIVESDKSKLPEGVLLRVSYPICNLGEKNHNNRKYPKAVWEKVNSDTDIKEKMTRRALFGHAEHPETTQSNLEKTSHLITKMWLDENTELATFEVLDTPYGRIIETLFRAGCQVGCSTRAEGDLKEAEDESGKYLEVVPESYRFVTVDFTADPSTYRALPRNVEMNLVGHIQKGVEEKKMDKIFAVTLLENLKSTEALSLKESIQKDVKEQKPVNEKTNVFVEGDGKVTVEHVPEAAPAPVVTVPAPVEAPAEEEPKDTPTPDELKDKAEGAEELKTATDMDFEDLPIESKTGKVVFEDINGLVQYLQKVVAGPKGDKLRARLSLSEKIEPTEIQKQITEMNIQLGEAKAERDKAIEILKANEGKSELLEKNYVTEVSVTMELKKKVEESDKKVKEFEANLSEANKKISQFVKNAITLEASKTKADAELKSLKESSEKALVKKYVETRIKCGGMKLPEGFLTLLEGAKTEVEADALFLDFSRKLNEDLLHFGSFEGKPADKNEKKETKSTLDKPLSEAIGGLVSVMR